MTSLVVWTSRLGARRWPPFKDVPIGDPRRPIDGVEDAPELDITRKSAGPEGLAFAPSWSLLEGFLDSRKRQRALFVGIPRDGSAWERAAADARAIEQGAWDVYFAGFMREMRASFRTQRAAWDRLLARDRVVLACFCARDAAEAGRCHRIVLAREVLPKLGVLYGGELVKPRAAKTQTETTERLAQAAGEGSDARCP